MKALSLTQPWATAIALGIKRWETRSWPTSFRGEVCIHAAKGMPKWAREFAEDEQMSGRLPLLDMPRGAIIAVADLTECRDTSHIVNFLTQQEKEFGDYSEGRYAFKFENVRVLPEPIFARGALGFWSVEWDEAVAVIRALKSSAHANEAACDIPFSDAPCGHSSQYCYTEDGGKHIVCLVCEFKKQEAAPSTKDIVNRIVAHLALKHGQFVGQYWEELVAVADEREVVPPPAQLDAKLM